MGATFEGQTKEEDGQVWADVVVEGLDHEVCSLQLLKICGELKKGRKHSSGTSGLCLRRSCECIAYGGRA